MTPAAQERAQHTPGPWRIEEDPNHWFDITGESENGLARLISLLHPVGTPQETEANARLIAAAPALLAACEAIVAANILPADEMPRREMDAAYPAIDLCRAAIAQAKGEKS